MEGSTASDESQPVCNTYVKQHTAQMIHLSFYGLGYFYLEVLLTNFRNLQNPTVVNPTFVLPR